MRENAQQPWPKRRGLWRFTSVQKTWPSMLDRMRRTLHARLQVRFTRNQTMLSVKTHPSSSVRHIKILAIRENIARAGSCGGLGREHSELDFLAR